MIRMAFVRAPVLMGFLGAVLGLIVGLLLIHVYFDHKALHDLVNMVNATATKPQPK